MTPEVSIIVPNYNHAPYLQQRLDSIMAQTFQDFEVILLDDASTDDSLDILKNYANHPKVSHFVMNERNSGNTFVQWKKGIELAKGKYIWIAESDDLSEKDFCSTLMSIFTQNENIDLLFCRSYIIDDHDNFIGICKNDNYKITSIDWNQFNLFRPGQLTPFFIKTNIIPNASAVIFKKELFIKYSGFEKDYQVAGDWYLWSKIAKSHNVAYVPTPLNKFRSHTGTTRVKKNHLKELETLRVLFSQVNSQSGVSKKDIRTELLYRLRKYLKIKRLKYPSFIVNLLLIVLKNLYKVI